MGLGDVVNELHDEHSLAHARTTEEPDLATSRVGGEQVDDLDTCDQEGGAGALFLEGGRVSVDREEVLSVNGSTLVNGLA